VRPHGVEVAPRSYGRFCKIRCCTSTTTLGGGPGVREENAGYVAVRPSHPSRTGSRGPVDRRDVMSQEAVCQGPQ